MATFTIDAVAVVTMDRSGSEKMALGDLTARNNYCWTVSSIPGCVVNAW